MITAPFLPIIEAKRGSEMAANVDILSIGYANDRVASTVVLVRDTGATIVVDPGMAAGAPACVKPASPAVRVRMLRQASVAAYVGGASPAGCVGSGCVEP
jgi:hypothetical protein